jgi:hypothetical protein
MRALLLLLLAVLCLLAPNDAKVSLPRTGPSRADGNNSAGAHNSNAFYSNGARLPKRAVGKVGTSAYGLISARASPLASALTGSASAPASSASASSSPSVQSALFLRAGQAISGFKKKSLLKKGVEVLEQVPYPTYLTYTYTLLPSLIYILFLPHTLSHPRRCSQLPARISY